MNPELKTYIDAGKRAYGNSAQASAEALRQALRLAADDVEELVAALKYLVLSDADYDPVATLLEAVLRARGLKQLVKSIVTKEEFIDFLDYPSVRDVFGSRLNNDPAIIKWARAVMGAEIKLSFKAIEIVCRLGQAEAQGFLRPNKVKSDDIDEMLEWLKLTSDEFFPDFANLVIDQFIEYKPESKGLNWLSTFLKEIIDYYGHSARAWISREIEARSSQPLFWQTALAHLLAGSQAQILPLHLTAEQNTWVRQFRLSRMRDQLSRQISYLTHHSGGPVIVQTPLLLQEYSSDFPGHEFRPVWSWLLSDAAEAAIYSWFHAACQDVIEDYASPEDSITGALCAYLKSHAANYSAVIRDAWQAKNPKEQMKLDLDYVDFRRGRDVGGADLVLVLSVKASGTYVKSSFVALQCKKIQGPSLKLNQRELIQKEQLRLFTHSSYYLLFSCEHLANKARGPILISARTIDGLLRARSTNTIDRDMLFNVGRPLEEYFVADLLPGWSGDDRWKTPDEIEEVVDANLRPVRIMRAVFTAAPIERG